MTTSDFEVGERRIAGRSADAVVAIELFNVEQFHHVLGPRQLASTHAFDTLVEPVRQVPPRLTRSHTVGIRKRSRRIF